MIHPSGASPPSEPPVPSPNRRPAIAKLLVANRGGSARRILRTAREMGIATVAVFTEADRDAPFVGEADEAWALDRLSDRGPAAYRDAPAVVEAARRAGADAVHPGDGLLADDAGFAWRCAEAGLLFVGPSPEAIATMASKLEAKGVAAGAGVPVLTPEEVDGYPPGKLEAAAEVLGWPVVAKASAGREARGMRVVREDEDLVAAVESARREAVAAFGDGTIFLEPWLESARLVEVQIFGDATGRVVHLFERDCSLQRRHRALVAEAPAPRVAPPLREQLHAAAVAVGEAVEHVGAGTVRFLLQGEQFWFLSMDTRLQPEHAVTEALLGLDLVRMQLAAAVGGPLPVEARHCTPSGHAVEARLCGEDPAGGRLRRFEIDPGPGLRVETGVASGTEVGPASAPLLATIVAHATTRAEALRRLAVALEGARIHGLRTNRDRLIAALRHPDVAAGGVDTEFLDRHDDGLGLPRGGVEAVRLHAAAAALAGGARADARFRGPDGQRIEVACPGEGTGIEVDGTPLGAVRVGARAAGVVDLEVDGVRRLVRVARYGAMVDVDSVLGHTELVDLDA